VRQPLVSRLYVLLRDGRTFSTVMISNHASLRVHGIVRLATCFQPFAALIERLVGSSEASRVATGLRATRKLLSSLIG
jgi:hypothetical protein